MRAKLGRYGLLILLAASVIMVTSVSFAAVIVVNSYQMNVTPVHPSIELIKSNNSSISSSINSYNSTDQVTYSSSQVSTVNESDVASFSNDGSSPVVLSLNLLDYSGVKYVNQIIIYTEFPNSSYSQVINLTFVNGTLSSRQNYSVDVGSDRSVSIGEKIVMDSGNAASSTIYIGLSLPFHIGSNAISYVGSSYYLTITTQYGIFY